MNAFLLLAALIIAAPAAATNYTLTVSSVGPMSPSLVYSTNAATGINCGGSMTTCSGSFGSGSVVTLTEVTASTVLFRGWTGTNGCGTNGPTCNVTVTAASAVTATFLPTFSLAVYGIGLGSVSDATGTVNCATTNGCFGLGAQTYAYPQGTAITLTEVAGASSTFVGWTGNAGCSTASTCTFTLNGYNTIVATFTSAGPFTIAVNMVGYGVVRSSPTGINCFHATGTCAAAFSSGTVVSLSTRASSGYYFAGWANGGCSGKTPCVITASSTLQGLGGLWSPGAFFYPTTP